MTDKLAKVGCDFSKLSDSLLHMRSEQGAHGSRRDYWVTCLWRIYAMNAFSDTFLFINGEHWLPTCWRIDLGLVSDRVY